MIKFMFLGPFNRLMPSEDADGFWVTDSTGKTVAEVVNTTEVINAKMNYAVLVNDTPKQQDYVLKDGDEVNILPLFVAG